MVDLAEANGQEKTEKPTSKRRREARQEGNVFQSKDAVTVIMHRYFSAVRDADPFSSSPHIYVYMAYAVLKCSLPLLLASMALGILSHGTQTHFNIAFKALRPKFSKMNPISGLKNMFSIKKLVDLAKNLIKISLLLALLYNLLKKDLVRVANMVDMNLLASAGETMQLVFELVWKVCLAFAIVAFFDYL